MSPEEDEARDMAAAQFASMALKKAAEQLAAGKGKWPKFCACTCACASLGKLPSWSEYLEQKAARENGSAGQ